METVPVGAGAVFDFINARRAQSRKSEARLHNKNRENMKKLFPSNQRYGKNKTMFFPHRGKWL